MMKKTALAIAAILLLAGCPSGKKNAHSTKKDTKLQCQSPAIQTDITEQLQQIIRNEAQRLTAQDDRHFVDSSKLIDAATRLQIHIENTKKTGQSCLANISIVIPKTILDDAETNAPLLKMTSPSETLLTRTANNNMRFEEDTLYSPINYSINNESLNINYHDNTISSLGSILAAALLPYGVKDRVMVNGQTISRDTALQTIQHDKNNANQVNNSSTSQVASETIINPNNTITIRPTPIKKERSTPITPNITSEPNDQTETSSSHTNNTEDHFTPQQTSSEEETPAIVNPKLEESRSAHEIADKEIKSAWRKIDPSIQQNLVDDQKNWEKQKNQRCRQAAAKGADDAESQYLNIQCDTRETRKRIKYLNGYSIQ